MWDRPPRRRGPEGSGPRSAAGARRRGNTRGGAPGGRGPSLPAGDGSHEPLGPLERRRDEVIDREPARHGRVRGPPFAIATSTAFQRRHLALDSTRAANQRKVLEESGRRRRPAGVELLPALVGECGHGSGGRNGHVASFRSAPTQTLWLERVRAWLGGRPVDAGRPFLYGVGTA